MIAFIIVLLPKPQIVVPPAHPAPAVRVMPSPTPVAVATPAPVKIASKEPVRKTTAGAPPPDSETQITMNIETADPNVRIIWISR